MSESSSQSLRQYSFRLRESLIEHGFHSPLLFVCKFVHRFSSKTNHHNDSLFFVLATLTLSPNHHTESTYTSS